MDKNKNAPQTSKEGWAASALKPGVAKALDRALRMFYEKRPDWKFLSSGGSAYEYIYIYIEEEEEKRENK